jgi:hypothetical protein
MKIGPVIIAPLRVHQHYGGVPANRPMHCDTPFDEERKTRASRHLQIDPAFVWSSAEVNFITAAPEALVGSPTPDSKAKAGIERVTMRRFMSPLVRSGNECRPRRKVIPAADAQLPRAGAQWLRPVTEGESCGSATLQELREALGRKS